MEGGRYTETRCRDSPGRVMRRVDLPFHFWGRGCHKVSNRDEE